MKKDEILSFIQRYSLNASSDTVAWDTKANKVHVIAMDDSKSVYTDVTLNTDVFKDVPGKKLPIYKSTSLVRMLSVLGDEFDMKLEMVGDIPRAFKFTSDSVKAQFALADMAIIPTVPDISKANIPETFEVTLDIDDTFVNTFVKSKSALPGDVDIFTVKATEKKVEFILGQTNINTNNIILECKFKESAKIPERYYKISLLKDILVSNKDAKTSEFEISGDGLIVAKFTGDNWTAKYYLSCIEENQL